MDLKINYANELESETKNQIDFIREEFDLLFGEKKRYTKQDQQTAAELLNYLGKLVDYTVCFEYLTETLRYLEENYKDLFESI